MDSYTDVRGQCCGSGRRGWDMHNRCCTCPTPACGDAPNMTWPSWDLGSGIAPIPAPYEEPRNVSCPGNDLPGAGFDLCVWEVQ